MTHRPMQHQAPAALWGRGGSRRLPKAGAPSHSPLRAEPRLAEARSPLQAQTLFLLQGQWGPESRPSNAGTVQRAPCHRGTARAAWQSENQS